MCDYILCILSKKMILRNFSALLAIIFINWLSYALASDSNYMAIIQQQSEEIKLLKTRIDKLEQTVNIKQSNILSSEVTEDQKGKLSFEQETNLKQQTEDKKLFFQENGLDQVKSEYDTALSYLKDGKFDEAEQKFAVFIQNHPKHKLKENGMFWYAESFYLRNNFNQSAINYLKTYKEYPKGSKASDALLKLSLSLGNLNKSKEACSVLDKLDAEFPKRSANSSKRSNEAKIKFKCTNK